MVGFFFNARSCLSGQVVRGAGGNSGAPGKRFVNSAVISRAFATVRATPTEPHVVAVLLHQPKFRHRVFQKVRDPL